jgi:hypothetical protein
MRYKERVMRLVAIFACAAIAAIAGCGDPAKSNNKDEAPAPAPRPRVVEVPALSLAPVPEVDADKAEAAYVRALQAEKAGNDGGAITEYAAALAIDPGHVHARYRLARLYQRIGEPGPALAILEAIAAARDCRVCAGRLVLAQRDPIWKSAALPAAVGAAAVETPKLRPATSAVVRGLGGELESAAPLLHHRERIAVTTRDGADKRREKIVGRDGFAGLAERARPLVDMKLANCANGCCTLLPKHTDERRFGTQVTRVCFATDDGGVRTLKGLTLVIEG